MAIVFDDEQINKPKIVFDDEVQQEPEQKGLLRRTAETIVDSPALPIVGGLAGMLGGAGVASIPLAGIGAAGAEGLRQVAARGLGLPSPQTSTEALKGIGEQAAGAAVGQGVGLAVAPLFSKAAIPLARRALGFSKRFLGTPFSRGQAQKAAQVALEKNVIPLSGSPSTMMSRATALTSKSGEKIGSFLKKIKFSDVAPEAEHNLELLRKELTLGTDRGVLAQLNKVINEIKDTIIDLYGRATDGKQFNIIKNKLGDSVNYLTESKGIIGDKKKIVASLGSTIRETIRKVVPENYSDFLEMQRLYSAGKLMQKGINNELAAQTGNRLFGPYAVIAATGQALTGSPGKAAATLGLTEAAMRRSAGTASKSLFEIGKKVPQISQAIGQISAPSATQLIKEKVLDNNGVQKYINMARETLPGSKDKNAIRTKARELASKDGFTWKGKK